MTLTVWSEQGERWWRDCMHCAYLMLMVFGGVPAAKFKLGLNSSAERERFEDGEGLPESQQEQGLVGYHYAAAAGTNLYGVVAHQGTEAELPVLLATVGVAIALTGNGPGLPPAPQSPGGFQGNHSITVVPLGNGQVGVLDPLQRSGARAVSAPVTKILAWHRRLTYGADIRYVREGEFAAIPTPVPTPIPTPPIAEDTDMLAVKGTATIRKADGTAATAPSEINPAIRLVSWDGVPAHFAVPKSHIFDIGGYNPAVIPGRTDGPSWLVMQDGLPYYLLAYNAIATLS